MDTERVARGGLWLSVGIIMLSVVVLIHIVAGPHHTHDCEEDELILGNGQCAHIDTVLEHEHETPTLVPTETETETPTATATETAAPVKTPRPRIPETGRQRITYYSDSFIGGPYACGGGVYDPTDLTVAAVSESRYTCDTRLEVCTEHACIIVVVKDRCECGGVDLSRAGWERLGGVDWASVRVIQ